MSTAFNHVEADVASKYPYRRRKIVACIRRLERSPNDPAQFPETGFLESTGVARPEFRVGREDIHARLCGDYVALQTRRGQVEIWLHRA